VIVGIYVLVFAFLVAKGLERKIRDHLVGIHVGRRSRAALDEIRRELVTELARDDPITGLHDGVGNLRVECAQIAVGHGSRLLHVAKCANEARLL